MKDKRVLVTGGTRGIGRATVLAFARSGARVVTCHRGQDGDEELEAQDIGVVRADVTRPEDVRRLLGECLRRLGGLDVLVNNVGRDGQAAIAELPAEEWRDMLDTGLTAAYLVTQAALPLFGPGASVINFSASAATRGIPERAHYTAAKAGVIGLTRSLAKELGPRGIRVNAIAPGLIDTGDELPAHIRERVAGLTSLGRLGTSEEVAEVVLFLAGDPARYVSGVTLPVDGGI
ncbi:SDR family NAD(P)-dependent oxidoreductase [Crossiella sp. NPDC003009]